MKIEKYSLAESEAGVWDSLVERSGTLSPFCGHAWLRLLEEAAGPAGRAGLWLALEGGEIVAGLPALERSGRFSVQSHSLPGGCPAGALQAPGAREGIAEALLESWASSLEASGLPRRLAVTLPDDRSDCLEFLQKKGFSIITQ